MDGPRALRAEDLPSLRELTDLVMRVGLVDQFPQLFTEENFANSRVCAEDGRCVSHIGMTLQDAFLFGCRTRVGCIGGVCTHPDYRKLGLASACFDDALQWAETQGADFLQVSGYRNLYRMRGCAYVGRDHVFTVTSDTQPSLPAGLPEVTVQPMTEAELPLVRECYQAEPVRFQRTPQDYHLATHGGWVMNRPSDFLVIREQRDFRGYVIAPRPEAEGNARLAEYAGDRRSLLAALPVILQRNGLTNLSLQVMRLDVLFRSLLEQAGLSSTSQATPGTIALLNFPRLMERMRPRFEEILGLRAAFRLRFMQEGTQCTFALDDQGFSTDRNEAARMLFGTPEGLSPLLVELEGELGDALRAILPLPTLWYGINYV